MTAPVAQAGSVLTSVVADGVLTLTMNRPERLNSIDETLLSALTAGFQAARSDEAVRCIVLTGAGRGFCAGADLTQSAMRSGGGAGVGAQIRERLQAVYAPLIALIRDVEKPVVAAVNGVAAGAGMSLALACDLRVAAESAYFLQAFVRIGLVPDAGSTYFLPRLVGVGRAMELAMLGERVPAAEALQLGLVNRVVPDESLGSAVAELAGRLARGPRSLGLIKRAVYLSMESDLRAQLANEENLQALAANTEDFVEGVSAFLEKRPAQFRGR
jgi:2-(1,2-epoxy-1,2-dihydrophenyl)acetyl-CoA isomerase